MTFMRRNNMFLVCVSLLVQADDFSYDQISQRTLQQSANKLQFENLSGYINLLGPITDCRVRLFSGSEIYGADNTSDANTGYYQFSAPARGKIRTFGSCFDDFTVAEQAFSLFNKQNLQGREMVLQLQAETGMDPNIHNIVVSPISTLVYYLLQHDQNNQLASPDLVIYYKQVGQLLGLNNGDLFGTDFSDLIGFNYVQKSVKREYLGIAVDAAVASMHGTVSLGAQFLTNIKSQQDNQAMFTDVHAAYKYMFLGLKLGTSQTQLDFGSQQEINEIVKYAFIKLKQEQTSSRKLLQEDEIQFDDIQDQVTALTFSISTANQEYTKIRDGSLIIARDRKNGRNTTQTEINLGLQNPQNVLQSIVEVSDIQQTVVSEAVKQLAAGNYDTTEFFVQFGGEGLSARFKTESQSNTKISKAFESFENEEPAAEYVDQFVDSVRESMTVEVIVAICCSTAGGIIGVILGAVFFARRRKVAPFE